MYQVSQTCAKIITEWMNITGHEGGYEDSMPFRPVDSVPTPTGMTRFSTEVFYHDNDQNLKRGFQAQ
jgi:hypothetical protein